MPDEHESAAAAWLDAPSTKREMLVIQARHPDWSAFQCLLLALQIEMLAALEVYGADEPPEPPSLDIGPNIDPNDEEPPEPWRGEEWKP